MITSGERRRSAERIEEIAGHTMSMCDGVPTTATCRPDERRAPVRVRTPG
jgi:hypothetical protein